MTLLLIDISGGTLGFAGVAFFLVLTVAAVIAFKVLKRTMKMAFRVTIVAIILAVAVIGSVALWAMGTGSSNKPAATRSR